MAIPTIDYDEIPPDASAMIESMRAHGYTLSTAIADLVDNSIAAGCSTIWISSHWAGAGSWISIVDDGNGMSADELVAAMRLGSKSPLDAREKRDLGRFGLGLKTSSFSQCRRLSVVTRDRSGDTAVRRWDLDHLRRQDVSGWQLLRSLAEGSEDRMEQLPGPGSGTAVIWEIMDRIVGDAEEGDQNLHDHFVKQIDDVQDQLSLVFHRYLSRRSDGLTILINGNQVRPWDPFLESHPATQKSPEEPINIPRHDDPVRVSGFVLPHNDKLGSSDHSKAAGPEGWNAQQGFYLYRNERLIVAGNWLGLGGSRPWTKEEHYKLARIRIDIPNSMDLLWQLDVKKSSVNPPQNIRNYLSSLAQTVRSDARAVFSHRGKYGPNKKQSDIIRPWKSIKKSGTFRYQIDRKHPLIDAVLAEHQSERKHRIESMLRVIEETVPVEQIWLNSSDSSDSFEGRGQPFHGATANQKQQVLRMAYTAIRKNRKLSHTATIALMATFEEFDDDEFRAIFGTMEETI